MTFDERIDEIIKHVMNGERLVFRFISRKIGYGFVWVKPEEESE